MWILPQDHNRIQLRDGRFVVHGLDPNNAVEVSACFFLEPERKLGAISRLSGRAVTDAAGPINVRLQPCGIARARLVTTDGKPLGHYPARWLATLVVTPGPLLGVQAKDGLLFAEEAGVTELDPVNYRNDFQSDAEGRLTFPALIPGATYRIEDSTPTFGGGDPVIRKEFTVQTGEALDLGDIVIASPQERNER